MHPPAPTTAHRNGTRRSYHFACKATIAPIVVTLLVTPGKLALTWFEHRGKRRRRGGTFLRVTVHGAATGTSAAPHPQAGCGTLGPPPHLPTHQRGYLHPSICCRTQESTSSSRQSLARDRRAVTAYAHPRLGMRDMVHLPGRPRRFVYSLRRHHRSLGLRSNEHYRTLSAMTTTTIG